MYKLQGIKIKKASKISKTHVCVDNQCLNKDFEVAHHF